MTTTLNSIIAIQQKQAELAALIAKLETTQSRVLEIPPRDIELKEGEHYAGVILGKEGKVSYDLILLPEELDARNWAISLNWAKSLGGDLPLRREQSLLYANLKEQFKPTGYWSSEQNTEFFLHAWTQYFNDGYQRSTHIGNEWRARAVRRVIIK